jgi:hypothetical protein
LEFNEKYLKIYLEINAKYSKIYLETNEKIWKCMCNDDIVLYDFIWKLFERTSVFSGTVCCPPELCLFLPSPFCDISGIWDAERLRDSVRCPSPSSLPFTYRT